MSVDERTGDQKQTERVSPVHIVVAAATVSALWFTFVGTRAPHEMEVGAASAALTVTFCAFARSRSPSRIALQVKDLIQAWRIPWYILSDVWEMTVVLLKDLLHIAPAESLYRVSPFATADEDPDHLGRRVLATAYSTATPSIIVIGIDVDQRRMLFHQIKRRDLPSMTKTLGAHP